MDALSFVAAVEASEAAQPGYGPPDRPAVPLEAGRGLDPVTGDDGDLASSQVGADEAVIVGFVRMELAGTAAA